MQRSGLFVTTELSSTVLAALSVALQQLRRPLYGEQSNDKIYYLREDVDLHKYPLKKVNNNVHLNDGLYKNLVLTSC